MQKGGKTDDVIMIKIGGDKKYPYYIKKIDTTHMSMANNKDGVDLVVPSHILQHKGESYYDDVRSWLKGGQSPDGKSYDSDYYAKGGEVAVRGYGDIHYSDFQDISANIEIDGQDEIEKIDIDDIDGGSPHDIFSQIDDIITRRAQTDSRYDNAKLTLVEFELKDGSFFDIYDLEDDFYSSEWRDNRYAKGGKLYRYGGKWNWLSRNKQRKKKKQRKKLPLIIHWF